MTKESQFYTALRDLFVGAKVEGESGFVNLMRIKSRYFEQGVFPQLQADIDQALQPFPEFRAELFDKLYTFFHRYFSESGSIYFRYTPNHYSIYEQVYTDDKDVVLFWKTHMLYYVKTDRIFNSLDVEVDDQRFRFDAAGVQSKRANEKREVIYSFAGRRDDGTLVLTVEYSERGRRTNDTEIIRAARQAGSHLTDETLERACRIFEQQSEVDYFINKNARDFLEKQLDLWLYQYVFIGQNIWSEERIRQIQTIKEIACKVIAFIAQFEDELVRIWNKPKFVLNSNYVITLDHIFGKDPALFDRFLAHPNMDAQIAEWRQLGMLPADFILGNIFVTDMFGRHLHPRYQYLPIDTMYYKDLELDLLILFENLEDSLDGCIIQSENYQALITCLPRLQSRIKTIYIDPPYNREEDDFVYLDRFKRSSWLTMMDNRLRLAWEILDVDGVILSSISREEVFELEQVINMIFGEDNRIGDLIWEKGRKNDAKYFSLGHDYILVYAKNENYLRSNKIVWREEKPGAQEILREYRRLKSIHTEDYQAIEEGIRRFYGTLPKNHIALKHRRYNRVDANGLWRDDNMSWPGGDGPRYDVIHPETGKPCKPPDGGWRFASLEKFKLYEDHGFIEYRKDHTEPPILKRYLNYVSTSFDPDSSRRRNTINQGEHESNVQVMPSVFYKNQQPPVLKLRDIMGKDVFKNPKDPEVISRLISYVNKENITVLDFFAGSGTTAQSVIELNRDGGRYKYLLIEMADYIYSVILPRLKKIIYSNQWKAGLANGGNGVSHFMKYW